MQRPHRNRNSNDEKQQERGDNREPSATKRSEKVAEEGETSLTSAATNNNNPPPESWQLGKGILDVLSVALTDASLTPRDVASAASVCRSWRDIIPKRAAVVHALSTGVPRQTISRTLKVHEEIIIYRCLQCPIISKILHCIFLGCEHAPGMNRVVSHRQTPSRCLQY